MKFRIGKFCNMNGSKSKFRLSNILIVLMLATLASAATYLITDRQKFPYQIVKSIERKVLGVIKRQQSDLEITTRDLSSVFLRLQLKTLHAKMPGVALGGGMTSVGNEILLINQVGDIYLVEDTGLTKTLLSVPQNGLNEYAQLANDPLYKDYFINSDFVRYNDIHYYENDSNAGLIISYTNWNAKDNCYNTTIATADLPHNSIGINSLSLDSDDWRIIYSTQPCLPLKKMHRAIEGHMAGGRIAFKPPSTVYIGNGEYHWDGLYAPKILGQSWDNDYGKVLKIDLNNNTAERLTTGHRNMQGILYEPQKDEVWVVEHGPKGGDELNKIVKGSNYGWPIQTLGTRYNYLPWPNTVNYGRHDLPQFKAPIYSLLPSVGISNLIQIKGFHESWDGDFLAASLSGKSLFRMRLRDDRVLFSERIMMNHRIRYVHQHTDGRIVMWTDDSKIIFLSIAPNDLSLTFIEQMLNQKIQDNSLRSKVNDAITACMECHAFNGQDVAAGPPLGQLYGTQIASFKNYPNYSDALQSVDGVWNDETLTEFLLKTQKFAPGSSMPNPNLHAEVANELVKIIRQLSTDYEQ